MPRLRLAWALAAALGLLLLAAGIGRLAMSSPTAHHGFLAGRTHAAAFEAKGEEHATKGGEAGAGAGAGAGGPAAARYNDMAFPRKTIGYAQVKADHTAFRRIPDATGIGGRSVASTAKADSSW